MQSGTSPNGQMQGRASPAPGFDPNQIPSQMRNQMMVQGPNGQMVPRSHPAFQQGQLTQAHMELLNQQQQRMVPNGTFPGGPQQMPPNMMPGQPVGLAQQPGQQLPNMTPRQGNNMPPPPAPQMNGPGSTQPSSPAPSAAPPTPSQANKPKPGGKKDNKKVGSNLSGSDDHDNSDTDFLQGKKGANPTTAASTTESEQPPTPTPATPNTPMNPNSFHQKQAQGGMLNGAAPQPPPSQPQPNTMPQPTPDMGVGQPFGNLDQNNQFGSMDLEFADLNGGGGDVLDNFDFDSFLNNDDGSGLGFDNFAFDTGLEAGGDGMQ
jgi:hypothetical protein